MRKILYFITISVLCVFAIYPRLGSADPILAVDFDSAGCSPTQDGLRPFAWVNVVNQAGPISATYTGMDTALTSGTVVITIASGTSSTATGNFTSRDQVAMAEPTFPLYYLLRDYVTTTANGPMIIAITGLKPGIDYLLSYTAYNNAASRTMIIADYTTGTAGVSGTVAWTAGTVFSENTDENICTRTIPITASESGTIIARVSSPQSGGVLISGLSLSRVPSSWHLMVSQEGLTQDWSSACLNHWNSLVTGSGTAPSSFNIVDTYYMDKPNTQLRTPVVTSTFGGSALILSATGQNTALSLNTSSTSTSTIPRLIASNGMIIQGSAGITQNLHINTFEHTSGTTALLVKSGRGLAMAVDTLFGEGALELIDAGTFLPTFTNASEFTGSIRISKGTLSVQAPLATKGDIVISSSSQVILNKPVYVTNLTIGGTSMPLGIYSYAYLHQTFPSVFTTGSATGMIAVYAVDANGPARMGGVNLSIAEWGNVPGVYGVDYSYPTASEFDYYHNKGLDLVRLPFRWERLQRTLNADLDPTELARMDAVVGYARQRGMKLVLDMHQNKYSGTLIGTGTVPVSAYRNFWRRLADHYKSETAIYGYDLMNEPHSMQGTWPASGQEAIWGIREVDVAHYVIVEGDPWAAAYNWEKYCWMYNLMDPVGKIIYEAHQYFDSDSGGSYGTYETEGGYPTIGIDRVRPFVNWVRAHRVNGYIGEFGVPYDDSRWLPVLDNFLQYVSGYGLSTTYWAGGPGWDPNQPFSLSCEPVNGVDRPQVSVLENYP